MERRIKGATQELRQLPGRRDGRGEARRRHLRQHHHAGLRLAEGPDPGLRPARSTAPSTSTAWRPRPTCRPSRSAASPPTTRPSAASRARRRRPSSPQTMPLDELIAQPRRRARRLSEPGLRRPLPEAHRGGARGRGAAGLGDADPRRGHQPLQADGDQGRVRGGAALFRRPLRRGARQDASPAARPRCCSPRRCCRRRTTRASHARSRSAPGCCAAASRRSPS